MNKVYLFFEACRLSKEGEALVCDDYPYQRIINNGGYFFWEESGNCVQLKGEFMEMSWRIEEE